MLDKDTLTEVMPADLDVGTPTDMEGTKQKATQTDRDLSRYLVDKETD